VGYISIEQYSAWDFDQFALVDMVLAGTVDLRYASALGSVFTFAPSFIVHIQGHDLAYDAQGHIVSGVVERIIFSNGSQQIFDISGADLDMALARLAAPGTYPLEFNPEYYFSVFDYNNAEELEFGYKFTGDIGNDTIFGSRGPDTLFGADGNDSIVGGWGVDEIYGGLGNDTIIAGKGGLFDGGDGNDLIQGREAADVMLGGVGNDTLEGGDGYDSLYGGDGNDHLDAGDAAQWATAVTAMTCLSAGLAMTS
jgi:hypothetical protein